MQLEDIAKLKSECHLPLPRLPARRGGGPLLSISIVSHSDPAST